MTPVPEEIWHQIFSHFECNLPGDQWWMYGQADHSPRKTLTSISLVCRRFHRVATPLLYRTIILDGTDKTESHQDHITRSLAASPNLGLDTRTISLKDDCLPTTTGFLSVLEGLLPFLELPLAMRRHMESELKEPTTGISRHRDISVAVFMLALMPCVRVVDINYFESKALIWLMSGHPDMDEHLIRSSDFEYSDTIKDQAIEGLRQDAIVRVAAQRKAMHSFANYGLPHLEELRLRNDFSRRDITPIHAIEATLLHPKLKVLRFLGVNWLPDSLDLLRWPNEPCGVQFLELRESLVGAASLRHILTRFTNLRTLIIHLAGCARYDEEWTDWELKIDEFGPILTELGQGLVELNLHTNNYDEYGDGLDEEYGEGLGEYNGYLGSLAEMQSLRHLSILMENLVDDSFQPGEGVPTLADVLPPSLETLHLHWDNHHSAEDPHTARYVNGAVRKLLEQGRMPNLRRVSIERYDTPECEFDGPVAGWDMTVENRKLWTDDFSPDCGRIDYEKIILIFERRD